MYTQEQIQEWKTKAEKWDTLDEKISACYGSEQHGEWVENDDDSIDLCTIGEIAASAFGFL